jgi:hypothetical protein
VGEARTQSAFDLRNSASSAEQTALDAINVWRAVCAPHSRALLTGLVRVSDPASSLARPLSAPRCLQPSGRDVSRSSLQPTCCHEHPQGSQFPSMRLSPFRLCPHFAAPRVSPAQRHENNPGFVTLGHPSVAPPPSVRFRDQWHGQAQRRVAVAGISALGGRVVDATPTNRRLGLHRRRSGETQCSVVSIPESWGAGDRLLNSRPVKLALARRSEPASRVSSKTAFHEPEEPSTDQSHARTCVLAQAATDSRLCRRRPASGTGSRPRRALDPPAELAIRQSKRAACR